MILSILLLGCTAAMASDSITVRIKGMKCDECAHKVMVAVRQEKGIESVRSNLERRTTTIVFDPALTSADSIQSRLKATGRFAPSPYDPSDVIRRGFGQRMDDMLTEADAQTIMDRVSQIEGVDSMGPHLDKHYMFIRYDANKTCKDVIRQAIISLGFTPVNYYSGAKVSYAFFNVPEAAVTQDTLDEALALDGVEDVNMNRQKKTLAVTFFNDETTADKLQKEILEILNK